MQDMGTDIDVTDPQEEPKTRGVPQASLLAHQVARYSFIRQA